MLEPLTTIRSRRTGRVSSWDPSGRNNDKWFIEPGETRVLADLEGPGQITHIWMTQRAGYRDCLLRFTWDDAEAPSVRVPLGDFFCLGHGVVANFQNMLFSASTNQANRFDTGCALNCYAPMPFRRRAKVELVNEGDSRHMQYFYIDYETLEADPGPDTGYFHAEFRRRNPFGGWGPEIRVNRPEANAANTEAQAWRHNYVILETEGRGHYIGCNLSVTNFQGTWWGEGDDMIWVDGYKWPPELHGTGSEDYLGQAWGMQPNAYLRNGSSIFERYAKPGMGEDAPGGGYQTSYVLHVENPVRFERSIKATIEHGHANHLGNEMSSVAYWYADRPTPAVEPPPAAQRRPVLADNFGNWHHDPSRQCPGPEVEPTEEMQRLKQQWAEKNG